MIAIQQGWSMASDVSERLPAAHLGMLLWAVIVGLSFPAVKLMSEGLPPLSLTALRFSIAALSMVPLMRTEAPGWPSARGFMLYAAMGLCLAGFFGTMFWAAHRVTALSMAALYVTVPLLAYCLGRGIGVEPRAGRLLAVLVLGASGALALALAQAGGRVADLQFGLGEFGFFLGCISSALYPVLSKWGLRHGTFSGGSTPRTFWSLLAGAIVVGLMALIFERPEQLVRMTFMDLLLVVYLGVVSSGVTFWIMQRATAVLSPAAVTAYSYLVPFVSMLILFIEYPERAGWQWLPGSLTVVIAIALLLRLRPAPQTGPQTGRR